jgi:hypothetical protein
MAPSVRGFDRDGFVLVTPVHAAAGTTTTETRGVQNGGCLGSKVANSVATR